MTAPGRFSSSTVPPWLWCWLIIFAVVQLPYYGSVWVRNLQDLFYSPTTELDWVTNLSIRILGLPGLLELVPSLTLLIGLMCLLWPQQRSQRLEQHYKLKPMGSASPAMMEILEFIHHHGPGLEVKVNRLRFDQTPFVYALGFRRTAIAIFGQLVKLWQTDRPAAEAILLHELAHYRHGDALMIGAGSPFRAVVERWGKLYSCLFLLPFLLSFVSITVLFFVEIGQLLALGGGGMGLLGQAILHKLVQTIFMTLGALFISINLLMWTTSVFIVPMVAIWCAELNADQAPASRSINDTLRALNSCPETARGRQWLLHRLGHPPVQLRRWMTTYRGSILAKVVLLLLFPLSFALQTILLKTLQAIAQAQGIAMVGMDRVVSSTILGSLWLLMAFLLALWPFIANQWEKIVCRQEDPYPLSPLPYGLSAVILGGMAILILGA